MMDNQAQQHKRRYLLATVVMVVILGMLLTVGVALGYTSMPGKSLAIPNQRTGPSATVCGLDWRIVPSDNYSGTANFYSRVAMISSNEGWGVGSYRLGDGTNQTLIEDWDGTEWNLVASPNASPGSNILYGVDDVSSTDAWAVGYYTSTGNFDQTLIERWNGTTWNIVPSPNVTSSHSILSGVDAISSTLAWAVGDYSTNVTGTNRTLIERWNGTVWTIDPSPDAPDGENYLTEVEALSANDAWAVGYYYSSTVGAYQTLIERWNGTAWTIVASPNAPGGENNFLVDISAASASDIWAIGYSVDPSNTDRILTLSMRWNGTTWSIEETIDEAGSNNLLGVAALPGNEAWAVGYNSSIDPVGPNRLAPHRQRARQARGLPLSPRGGEFADPIILHWIGGKWEAVAAATSGNSAFDYLVDVDAVSTTDVLAVGYTLPAGGGEMFRTLAERYNEPCVATSTSTATTVPSATNTTVPSATNTTGPSSTSTSTATTVPTATSTNTPVPSSTNTMEPSSTSTRTATTLPTSTRTSTTVPSATSTACPIQFADVPPTGEGSTFYEFIRCLACRGIVGGYPCGGPGENCNGNNDPYYRPGANVTRGQLSKIIANSAGLDNVPPPGQQQFADVEPGDPFYLFVERLAETGAIGGYPCGSPGDVEPCDAENRPFFRPSNPATRGQISKIVSIAAGFDEQVPAGQQTFTDVPSDSPFWVYIERLSSRGVISGYGEASKCPTGTPCFRYNDLTTRGQMAKIAANAFFPNCQTPARR
ncbi:MAG TPA: S-layer homology domain-containing protein [Chloroflexia bacterium]